MFSIDKDLVANFEVRCWRLVFVSGDLVLFLSIRGCQSELLVKFVKVDCKIMGMGRDKVSFGVDGEVWSVALVGKEG